MRLAAAPLVLALAALALAQEEAPPAPTTTVPAPEPQASDGPVLRLRIEEVGRLALRNSPRFRSARLDPAIARTFEDEARGEFDPLFAARATGGRDRSEIFFDPSAFGPGGSSDPRFLVEDTYRGGADVSATEDWGGVWTLGVDATSSSRRGANSIQTLQPRYESALSLGYVHPLLRGAGSEARLAGVRAAESRSSGSESRLYREAERTVLAAETLYWSLVRARADREVVLDSLRTARELQDIAKARLDVGRGIPADVVEADAGVARREGELIDIENQIRNLSDRLRELVMPFDRPDADLELRIEPAGELATDIDGVPALPTREDLETALAHRADMQAAQAELAATRHVETRARSEHEYELNALLNGALRGLGSGFSDASDQWRDRDSYVWTAGFELAIPLGNVTAAAQLLRAERERQRAEREVAALRNEIVREVREASRNVRSAADRIAAALRERDATEAQLAAERSRLEKGKATPFDVLEVEEDRSRAVARVIAARVDLEIARSELSSANGRLLEERDVEELAVGE